MQRYKSGFRLARSLAAAEGFVLAQQTRRFGGVATQFGRSRIQPSKSFKPFNGRQKRTGLLLATLDPSADLSLMRRVLATNAAPQTPAVPAASAPAPAAPAAAAADSKAPAEPEKKVGKFRELWNKYGVVALGTHLGIYALTLGGLYVVMSKGYMKSMDVIELVKRLGMESHFEGLSPKMGTFTTAWIATKLTEPVRLPLTVLLTPRIARLVQPMRDSFAQSQKDKARVLAADRDKQRIVKEQTQAQQQAQQAQAKQPSSSSAGTSSSASASAAGKP